MRSSRRVGFGIVTYRPGGNLGPRMQDSYQLVVIHRGDLHLRIDEGTHAVRAGQGILLAPGGRETFQFSPQQETTHSWCQLQPELLPALFTPPSSSIATAADCSPWLLNTMRTGWRLPASTDAPHDIRIRLGAVLMALAEFCRPFAIAAAAAMSPGSDNAASGSTAPVGPLPPALIRTEAALQEKLSHAWTLDALARVAGVSRGHLIKLAREHWSTTPMERLWRSRVEEAARLLRDTGLSIAEVAYRTGFANPFHFSRRFTAHFGRHPRAWRTAAWDGIGTGKESTE
ncbi:MAG: helix-turn-helix domain-containing protein [Candidatus Methylacidiphilales bacterium]